MSFNVPEEQLILAFFGPAPAGGDQLTQLAVASAGAGQQNEPGQAGAGWGIFEFKPAAGNQFYRAVFQGSQAGMPATEQASVMANAA